MSERYDAYQAVENSWHAWGLAKDRATDEAKRLQSLGENPLLSKDFKRLAEEAERRHQEFLAAVGAYEALVSSGEAPEEWLLEFLGRT